VIVIIIIIIIINLTNYNLLQNDVQQQKGTEIDLL